MTEANAEPQPDLDAVDEAAEQIIPPEQAPMDDAAGGPSIDEQDEAFTAGNAD